MTEEKNSTLEAGRPAPELLVRWRLYNCGLPLENRLIRSLSQRKIKGEYLSVNLLGWAKQHIEWTLAKGAAETPNGVLMIVVENDGSAVMVTGPFQPLEDTSLKGLYGRAREAQVEKEKTNVAPEILVVEKDGKLTFAVDAQDEVTAVESLVVDLAKTRHMELAYDASLLDEKKLEEAVAEGAGVALLSDEYGVVLAKETLDNVPLGQMAFDYQTLLEKTGN